MNIDGAARDMVYNATPVVAAGDGVYAERECDPDCPAAPSIDETSVQRFESEFSNGV